MRMRCNIIRKDKGAARERGREGDERRGKVSSSGWSGQLAFPADSQPISKGDWVHTATLGAEA